MKKFGIVFVFMAVIFTCFSTSAFAADAIYSWAGSMGGTSADRGYSVAVDSSGNVYTTGFFNDTVDFDLGVGTANLTSAGSTDIFISKIDSSGAYVWAKKIGGTSNDEVYSIAVDASGNVYTTGYFTGTADFDPGAGTANLTSTGSSDIFISKLDSSGAYVWAVKIGSAFGDQGNSIAVDTSGNVYTTGFFGSTADFDPGAGTANLTPVGSGDTFISKLDSSGAYVWAKQIGSTSNDQGNSIAVDTSGNVYTTGYFNGTGDFDPDAGTANLTSSDDDIFVSKLDSSGAYVWARKMGGISSDYGNSIAVDSSGNVYTTGFFIDTADFDPGAGTANLTPAGSAEIFISKLDSSGANVRAKQFGNTGNDRAFSIAVDTSDNVYTTGFFEGTVDFDPNAGIVDVISNGGKDIFISKLDSSGLYVWVKQLGGISDEFGYSVAVDASNNVYTEGYFEGTADFDPGAGTANLTSAGSTDIFVLKLISVSAPTISTISASSQTPNTATLTGNITATGGVSSTIRGFDIGLDTSYTMTDITESGSYSTGTYTLNAVDLSCNTVYHYRAYSTNSIGTSTGSDDVFTTQSCPINNTSSSGGYQAVYNYLNLVLTPVKKIPIFEPEIEIEPEIKIVPEPIIPEVKLPKVVVENSKTTGVPAPVETPNISNPTPGKVADDNADVISIFETPIVKMLISVVPVMGIVLSSTASIAISMFASPLSMSEIFLIPMRLWALLMTALGLKKRNLPWGTVYDSVTKQPIDPAYVVLYDSEGKEVADSITDLDGRYGFLVGPGTYHIVASKTHYRFPSAKLRDNSTDELYNNLYFGSDIVVEKEGDVISVNIPLDAEGFDWNEFTKKEGKLTQFYSDRYKIITYISNILFIFGLVVAIIAAIVAPVNYNFGILILYIILFILRHTILKIKPQGVVLDKLTDTPISFAIVRVYSRASNREVIHKVTDRTGKYYCLIPNGEYYATVERKNSDGTYTKVYTGDSVIVTNGYFKDKFVV